MVAQSPSVTTCPSSPSRLLGAAEGILLDWKWRGHGALVQWVTSASVLGSWCVLRSRKGPVLRRHFGNPACQPLPKEVLEISLLGWKMAAAVCLVSVYLV